MQNPLAGACPFACANLFVFAAEESGTLILQSTNLTKKKMHICVYV